MAIITSFLDTDWYKFKVSYAAWKCGFGEIPIESIFMNRSNNNIDLPELKTEFGNLEELTFKKAELDYLEYLTESAYIDFLLKNMQYKSLKSFYSTEIKGKFSIATLYETLILSTYNELYANEVDKLLKNGYETNLDEFVRRTEEKLQYITNHPEVKFIEFGTRRRRNKEFQNIFFNRAMTLVPNNIIGTSNVLLAKEHNLPPKGTMPHEWPMFFAAKNQVKTNSDLIVSQIEAINMWFDVFEFRDDYVLSDTFGSDWFFKHIFPIFPNLNIRQDSGLAEERVEQIEHNYSNYNHPSRKAVASDGLNLVKCVNLKRIVPTLNLTFGLGTNATFDCFIKPISIVVKLNFVDGFPAVKISDNPNKGIGNLLSEYIQFTGYGNVKPIELEY